MIHPDSDLKSLAKSYCLLRQYNRQLDTEGLYSEGVCILSLALKDRGIDAYNPEQMKAVLLGR